jgi:hypothetical protein
VWNRHAALRQRRGWEGVAEEAAAGGLGSARVTRNGDAGAREMFGTPEILLLLVYILLGYDTFGSTVLITKVYFNMF